MLMKKFVVKEYEIHSDKITGPGGARFAVLSDLHGSVFGKDNEELLEAIYRQNPDAVLIAGDIIVRSDQNTFAPSVDFLKRIVNRYPVYYSLGNHEFYFFNGGNLQNEYISYEKQLTEAGVCFLHNKNVEFTIRGNKFTIYGLEIPMIYYRKPRSPVLKKEEVDKLIGKPEGDGFRILLAHNPGYGRAYFDWGADLILSGHYHGGVLRFGENRGLISPQFRLFPSYCCGVFQEGNKHMIVSAGLGEHTIPVRIHNPRELLAVTLLPEASV